MDKPVHGGLDPAELRDLGLCQESVIDFSASINPLGTPSAVREAIAGVDPAAYPDRECTALRGALSAHLGVGAESVLVGNGSTELVHLLARAHLGLGSPALVFGPTFGEYEAAALAAGATVSHALAEEGKGFRWQPSEGATLIRQEHPALVFLCNPNNPTGVYLDESSVRRIAGALDSAGLLVVDEAYVSFVDEAWDSTALLQLGNVALLRSMTKDYGLAGLRLGYLLAPPGVVDRVGSLQPSWSVNALAQAAGVAALGCQEHLAEAREVVWKGRAYLEGELSNMGLAPVPSSANFLLVKVGGATELRRRLLARGLCFRDCSSFGLPDYIRIAVLGPEECRRLVRELKGALADG